MKNVKLSQAKLRKRKMLMVLPLLVIPFMTMGFYALGGGSKADEPAGPTPAGLNAQLPDANLKEESLVDKLGFYDKAAKDSAKMEEYMRSDPYYSKEPGLTDNTGELQDISAASASKYNQRLNVSPYERGNRKPEDEVVQKLALLQQQLNQNTNVQRQPQAESYALPRSSTSLSGDVERLETMMNRMSGGDPEEDPEIKQLSSVMDKILDIQHPGRVKERLQQGYKESEVPTLSVSSRSQNDTTAQGFFSFHSGPVETEANAIKAVVNETKVLVDGSIIKLRLLQDVFISGKKVSAGTFVFGTTSLNGERLDIAIHSIRHGHSLYTIKMEVYDMDGLPGIHIPGAITRDVARQSADNSLQLLQLSGLDPSLKAQAATAGINTAKSLISKKMKMVKVTVKAGYKVLLADLSVR